jgi:hypothetical protein
VLRFTLLRSGLGRPKVFFPRGQCRRDEFVNGNPERLRKDDHLKIGNTTITGFDLGNGGTTYVESPNPAAGREISRTQIGGLAATTYLEPNDVSSPA